jgi:hypothetical protein
VLTDPSPAGWRVLRPGSKVDGVFLVAGASAAEIANIIALELAPVPGNGWKVLHEEHGVVRPTPAKGHEHFGYADGVSQPGVRGQSSPGVALTPSNALGDENQGDPGQDLLWPGEFLFGYPGQDKDAPNFTVKGPVQEPPVPFMQNGAFLRVPPPGPARAGVRPGGQGRGAQDRQRVRRRIADAHGRTDGRTLEERRGDHQRADRR